MDVKDADRVLDFLESENIVEIVLFITHSDRDHTFGVQDLLAELEGGHNPTQVIGVFFSRDRLHPTKGREYEDLIRLIGRTERRLSRNDPLSLAADFNTLLNHNAHFAALFRPVKVMVMHPDKADQDSLVGSPNETAGVLLIEYIVCNGKSGRVLLTADVQLSGISLMLSRSNSLRADVLMYPHHGAWPLLWPRIADLEVEKKTMEDFLCAVMPSHVVFSVGANNAHGHIRPESLALLSKYHSDIKALQSVSWTEMTEACRNVIGLPVANNHNSADVEAHIGEQLRVCAIDRQDRIA